MQIYLCFFMAHYYLCIFHLSEVLFSGFINVEGALFVAKISI